MQVNRRFLSVVSAAALCMTAGSALAQPLNDVCGANQASFTIPGSGGSATQAITGWTRDGAACTGSTGADVYYYFTPDTTGTYSFSTCTSTPTFDSVLSLHTGCPTSAANFAGTSANSCADDTCPGALSSFTSASLTAGTPYTIRVGRFSGALDATVTLVVAPVSSGACCTGSACTITASTGCTDGVFQGANTLCTPSPCPPPPANDDCAGAIALNGDNVTVSGSTLAATTTVGSAAACVGTNFDVYYAFTPLSGGGYTANLCAGTAPFDSVLSVHTACPGTVANQVAGACNDDGCTGGFGASAISTPFTLTAGVTYFVRVAGFTTATFGPNRADFVLNINSGALGTCCEPSGGCTVTTAAGCAVGSTFTAGNTCFANPCPQPTGACCAADGGCTVTEAASCTGAFTAAGVCSPNPCTQPSGSCCDTLGGCTVVNGVDACVGAFTVAGTCTPNICPVPPANDTCGGAITVSVGTPAATGDNTSASTSLDEDTTCIGSLNGVWYDFTAPPAGGSFQIDTEGSAQFDTVLAVFSACGGTELACDDEGGTGSLSLLVINLAPSQNIKILVATWEFEDPGAFNLNISSVTTGACCSTSGVCTTSSPAACLTGYQGDNTVCTPNPCPQPGACCDAGGCCTLVQVASCTGTFNGAASCTPNPCGAAPANDECAGAIALSVNSAVSGSTCLATTSAEAASTCQTLSNADVWYSFAPAASGTFTITACGSAFDTILTLFTGACGAVTEVDCDDDTCDGLTPPGSGLASIIPDVALNSGTTYLIRLSSFGSSRGTFTLSVTGEAAVTGACCCGSTCSLTTAAACTGTNTFFSGTGTVCNAPGNNSTPCCVTDYNKSGGAVGQTTVQDIFDFLAGYFSADACADINGGGVSVQDIFDFLSAYFAAASGGC